jgi:gluconokinase
MRAGIPLNDADRAPWLYALRNAILEWLARNENVVLACSALKADYRERLVVGPQVHIVYLRGNFDLLANRLSSRQEHYMNPALLRSQFETLEEPHDVPTIDVDKPVPEIVDKIRGAIGV